MLIIIIFCSQIVPFIWWAQPINLAWIWSGICLEVCFDLKITLKLCLELFLCMHVHLCVPGHMDRNSSYFSTVWMSAEHYLPVTVFLNLEKKERKRYFNPFAHNSTDFSGNSSSSERVVLFRKADLTQQVLEFCITQWLHILPCQIRTKNTSLSSQGPYCRSFPRHLESQM